MQHESNQDEVLVAGPTSYSKYVVKQSRYGTLVSFADASVDALSARLDAVKRRLAARDASIFASHVGVMSIGPGQTAAYGWILHSPVADTRAYDEADTASPE